MFTPANYTLDDRERARLAAWLDTARFAVLDANEAECVGWLQEQYDVIPAALLDALQRLDAVGTPHILVVRGLPLDAERVPPTPTRYVPPDEDVITDADLLHGLLGATLGEPIGFKGQQHGRIFNNIIPLKDHKAESNHSAGFLADFGLHTEDSFFPLPPTFFGLICARNLGKVPSRFARLADAITLVPPADVDLLRTAKVLVHLNAAQALDADASSMPKLPIIWGPTEDPYFRINGAAPIETDDETVGAAIDRLLHAFDAIALTVTLDRGDVVWVANRRVAHGRDAYAARLDGADRWMKRLVVVPDLKPLAGLLIEPRIVDNELLATVPVVAGWGR